MRDDLVGKLVKDPYGYVGKINWCDGGRVGISYIKGTPCYGGHNVFPTSELELVDRVCLTEEVEFQEPFDLEQAMVPVVEELKPSPKPKPQPTKPAETKHIIDELF